MRALYRRCCCCCCCCCCTQRLLRSHEWLHSATVMGSFSRSPHSLHCSASSSGGAGRHSVCDSSREGLGCAAAATNNSSSKQVTAAASIESPCTLRWQKSALVGYCRGPYSRHSSQDMLHSSSAHSATTLHPGKQGAVTAISQHTAMAVVNNRRLVCTGLPTCGSHHCWPLLRSDSSLMQLALGVTGPLPGGLLSLPCTAEMSR
jgi:hypothetical protein